MLQCLHVTMCSKATMTLAPPKINFATGLQNIALGNGSDKGHSKRSRNDSSSSRRRNSTSPRYSDGQMQSPSTYHLFLSSTFFYDPPQHSPSCCCCSRGLHRSHESIWCIPRMHIQAMASLDMYAPNVGNLFPPINLGYQREYWLGERLIFGQMAAGTAPNPKPLKP